MARDPGLAGRRWASAHVARHRRRADRGLSACRLFAASVRSGRYQIRLSPERHAVDLPRRHVLQAHQDRRRRRQGSGAGDHRIAGLRRPALFPVLQAGQFREGQGSRPVVHRGALQQARFDRRRHQPARHLPGQAGRPRGHAHRAPASGRSEERPRPAPVVHRERLFRTAADARRRAVPRPPWEAAATTAAPWRGCATSRAPCCRAPSPRKA